MSNDRSVLFENAKLIFRNFAGRATPFAPAGRRTFAVVIEDHEFAKRLAADGWNVKFYEKKDEEDEDRDPFITVRVRFEPRPPRIVLLSSSGRNEISEEEVNLLDHADIAEVDLMITPFDWEVGGKTGTAAYLSNMYVTLRENELDLKYANRGIDGGE